MSTLCTHCGTEQHRESKPGDVVLCSHCARTFTAPDSPELPSVAAHGGIRDRIRAKSGCGKQEAEMDMTPMVDVTFQLLIFFMLTASFVMQRSLQIPKPEKQEASAAKSIEEMQDQDDMVVVRVDGFNTFFITAPQWEDEIEIPSAKELLVKLKQARMPDAQGKIPSKLLVVAHGDALHEKVVTAIDAGNEVGMDSVQLMTTEDDSGT